MNKNVYLNFMVTVLVLVLIVLGVFLINAVDLLRIRTGEVYNKLARIDDKLDSMRSTAPISIQNTAAVDNSNHQEIARNQMANSQFYDPTAPDGGRMINAIQSETKNMNYMVNNESFVSSLWSFANDALAERNYQDVENFEPQLAESWTISEDKLVYTIKLKKGVLWHDFKDPVNGKDWKNVEVTAADFKFYVDVIKNPDTDCAPARGYFKDLDKIEIINDYEFKVYWKKKYFKSKEITLGLSPLPRHLYHAYEGEFDGKKFNDDHQRNRIIVGCGPYRFVKWDKGQRIIMQRWEKYYGKKYNVVPALKTLVFEVIKHPNTRLQSLLSGTIDELSLNPEQWINRTNTEEFGENGKIKKLKYPGMRYSYIGYNLKNPLFKDKRVRQALTHLVNRKRILKDVYHNLARITTGPFFIDGPYYDKKIKPYEFSVEEAKKLLKEAGWKDSDNDGILDKDGKKFEFTVMAPSGSSILPKMLPIIKEDMAKAGIVLKIVNIEWSVYVQRLEKKSFEVCVLAWTLSLSPDPYQLWHSSQAEASHSSNHIGFKSKDADELIEQIRVTFDLQKRIELCHKFHQLLHEEQPYTFLVSPYNLQAIDKRYHNVRVFPTGVPTRIMWVPEKEQKKIPGFK